MAFKIPTESELRKVVARSHTPLTFTVDDDGKERTYKTRLVGTCEDTPAGYARLAGAQTADLTKLTRADKSVHAGGKLKAGLEHGITSAALMAWLLRYDEATAEGRQVTVAPDGSIVPEPVSAPTAAPEPTSKRKHKERGGIDPALIPEATAGETPTNGEAGNG